MREQEYLEKLEQFKLKEEHTVRVMTLPFLLLGAVDKRLSLQEVRVMDVYENEIRDTFQLEEVPDPEGFFEFIIQKFEETPFAYVKEVSEVVNYQINRLYDNRKLKLKNILASGLYMVASASKETPSDETYISQLEIQMIEKLVNALNLDELEYGRKLLKLKM